MSEPQPPRQRRTRADAERRRLEILEAAARLLGRRPEPSVEDVAAASGVSRQTVYAHYPSRNALRVAAFDHAVTAALAALDAAGRDSSGATGTLLRMLEQSWRTLERYPVLMDPPPEAAGSDWTQHQPVVDRLLRLVLDGQRSGEIDPERPAEWLVGATIGLGHAAAEQVAAGLLAPDRAMAELRLAVRRLLSPATAPNGSAAPNPSATPDGAAARDRSAGPEGSVAADGPAGPEGSAAADGSAGPEGSPAAVD